MNLKIKGDKVLKAEEGLECNSFSSINWTVLLKESINMSVSDCRATFETAVSLYPIYYKFWIVYIEKELKERNFDNVEMLFKRCLPSVPNVELWRLYLNYLKENKSCLSNFKDKMTQAFEIAVDAVGFDVQSNLIWQDYILFLKSEESHGSFAEGQKIMNIRKIFQRAINVPMQNLDGIWKDYSTFEQSVNKTLSEKLLAEKVRDLNNSKRVAKDIETNIRGIIKSNIPTQPALNSIEFKQKQLWRNYIEWEESNPLHIEDDSVLIKRVIYTYEQFLMCFCFHADVWYDACHYLQKMAMAYELKKDMKNSDVLNNECLALYDKAINGLMNKNLFIHLSYIDVLEKCKKYDMAINLFESMINNSSFDSNIIYINYMRFSRKVYGIDKMRSIFKRARQNPLCSYHVYLVAANIELRINNQEQAATKIIDLGLSRFHNNETFVVCFMDHLKLIKDNLIVRSFYEKLLAVLPQKYKNKVFEAYYNFEVDCNSSTNLYHIENRINDYYHSVKKLNGVLSLGNVCSRSFFAVNRFRSFDLTPCSIKELKSMGMNNLGQEYKNHEKFDIEADYKLLLFEPSFSKTDCNILNLILSSTNKNKPIPDYSQMRPFKPVPRSHAMSCQFVSGGIFPPPTLLTDLIIKMPQSSNFNGPFVRTEELMSTILEVSLNKNVKDLSEKRIKECVQESTEESFFDDKLKSENQSFYQTSNNQANYSNSLLYSDSLDVFKIRQQIRSSLLTS